MRQCERLFILGSLKINSTHSRTVSQLQRYVIATLILLFLSVGNTADAQSTCEGFFRGKDQKSQGITNLAAFGEAMTQGMLLSKEQGDLFDVYRNFFFGDSTTDVGGYSLKSVQDLLAKNPGLEKPHFREQEIALVRRSYETPESFAKFLSSQNASSGQVRSSLFQIEANLGFWKKVLDFKERDLPRELQVPENLRKDFKMLYEGEKSQLASYRKKQKEFERQQQERFLRYLGRIIKKENRDLLLDPKVDYKQKVLTLFKVLERLNELMEKKGRNTLGLRQAMVDLVATSGFMNQATQSLLKSRNGLERLEGFKKVLDERDTIAMELGFKGHFQELLEKLNIEFPTGSHKGEDLSLKLADFEREILSGNYTSLPAEVIRVRSLSIQEAPFRSCLGGSDCSSRTYFSKALDPNYNYFTMTDSQNNSSGHVTVVLGTATAKANVAASSWFGKFFFRNQDKVPVAFVDKLQNVPNQMIPAFLEAVRISLLEKGYVLVLPANVGDHNGLSNMDTTRHFVSQELLPRLNQKLGTFTPHPHQYKFENQYSRAEDKLDVRIFENPIALENTEIRPGRQYQASQAPKDLNKEKLVQELLALRNSKNEEDVSKYVSSGTLIESLEKLGLYSQKQFKNDLIQIVSQNQRPYPLRKQAFLELVLIDAEVFQIKGLKTLFETSEFAQIASEVRQWTKSSNKRRKAFAKSLNDKLFEFAESGNNETEVSNLIALGFIDPGQLNSRGRTALMVAVTSQNLKAIEALLNLDQVNVTTQDSKGFTAFDYAVYYKYDKVQEILRVKRPRIHFEVKAPHILAQIHQSMQYVGIKAGKFRMGENPTNARESVEVEITTDFEMMSTPVTQRQWAMVMKNNPSRFVEGEESIVLDIAGNKIKMQPDHPVEQVSWNDVQTYITSLNKLSESNDPLIYEVIPGHKKGYKYRLPTEAEWEYVVRNRGQANDTYHFGSSQTELAEHAWFSNNSNSSTEAVGQKKPLLVDNDPSKPIHDLHGNVWEWVQDWYGDSLNGGKNPQGPKTGSLRVVRGGSWSSGARYLRSAYRGSFGPGDRYDGVGFRLLRTP